MGNGYGSYRSTRESEFRAYDALPKAVRDLLKYTVADWPSPPVLKELRAAFAVIGSRQACIELLVKSIRQSEEKDCYRTYGPDHPQANAHGKKLRRAKNACWGARRIA